MNAVVVVAIGRSHISDISLPNIKTYCLKHNIAFELITEAKYGFENNVYYHWINLEKNQIYHYFDKYDRILRLDSDILITPNCPNIFDVMPEDSFCAVPEDIPSRWENRREQIVGAEMSMGPIKYDRYFNSGVVLASTEHKEAFNLLGVQFNDINLGSYKEQTLLNYKVAKLGLKTHWMDCTWNHLSMFSLARGPESNIIHYAGPQEGKEKLMARDLVWMETKNDNSI
jgi:lipopolysaccharide biosynthesis glycosyltransferase